MKTRLVAPWNLRPGMKLAPLTNLHETQGSRYRYVQLGNVRSVQRIGCRFSGKSAWRVITSTGESLLYFGRTRHAGAEKVTIQL